VKKHVAKFRGWKIKAWSSSFSSRFYLRASQCGELKLELHAFSMKEALIQLTTPIQATQSSIENPIGPATG
jgi:hypothetical protein